jgi:hypothetical protein
MIGIARRSIGEAAPDYQSAAVAVPPVRNVLDRAIMVRACVNVGVGTAVMTALDVIDGRRALGRSQARRIESHPLLGDELSAFSIRRHLNLHVAEEQTTFEARYSSEHSVAKHLLSTEMMLLLDVYLFLYLCSLRCSHF